MPGGLGKEAVAQSGSGALAPFVRWQEDKEIV